jgi:hypothetical protein
MSPGTNFTKKLGDLFAPNIASLSKKRIMTLVFDKNAFTTLTPGCVTQSSLQHEEQKARVRNPSGRKVFILRKKERKA